MTTILSIAQSEALAYVKKKATLLNQQSKVTLTQILQRAQVDEALLQKALAHIQTHAQVVLHFHPDRLNSQGQSVAEALLDGGFYHSQFETKLSNGGLTAFKGGDRDKWEQYLFGGAYQKEVVSPLERPKYGALDLMNHADGAAPRFGSCYFRLKQVVCKRCSFTDKDSVCEPTVFGTIDNFSNIMASLLTQVENEGTLFGAKNLHVSAVLTRLSTITNPQVNYAANYGRTLDAYVEAQIHGPVDLAQDVQTLVADPSFQNTEVGHTLEQLCTHYNIELDWHAGFQVRPHAIPDHFRGPVIPRLAQHIAKKGIVNTAMLGQVATSLAQQPEAWHDWGSYADVLQYIKQLWHALAYYGQPLGD